VQYVEDIDDEDVTIPISKDTKKLVEAKKQMSNHVSDNKQPSEDLPSSSVINWPTTNGEGKTRPRWKFVAQTANTRELKKKRSKHRSYTNNNPVNTLVEEDGQLREATLADVKLTSWKPVRNVMEHTYGGAKKGWLDRTVRGDQSAWGKAPPVVRSDMPLREVVQNEKEQKGGGGGGDDDDDDDSDSSSSSSSEDSSNGSGEDESSEEDPDVDADEEKPGDGGDDEKTEDDDDGNGGGNAK